MAPTIFLCSHKVLFTWLFLLELFSLWPDKHNNFLKYFIVSGLVQNTFLLSPTQRKKRFLPKLLKLNLTSLNAELSSWNYVIPPAQKSHQRELQIPKTQILEKNQITRLLTVRYQYLGYELNTRLFSLFLSSWTCWNS